MVFRVGTDYAILSGFCADRDNQFDVECFLAAANSSVFIFPRWKNVSGSCNFCPIISLIRFLGYLSPLGIDIGELSYRGVSTTKHRPLCVKEYLPQIFPEKHSEDASAGCVSITKHRPLCVKEYLPPTFPKRRSEAKTFTAIKIRNSEMQNIAMRFMTSPHT